MKFFGKKNKNRTPKTPGAPEIQGLLDDASTFVLDVRTPMEFQQGALPRAYLIPINDLPQRVHELPQDKDHTILIYCAHGVRSLSALHFIKSLGYKCVFHIEGGLAQLKR